MSSAERRSRREKFGGSNFGPSIITDFLRRTVYHGGTVGDVFCWEGVVGLPRATDHRGELVCFDPIVCFIPVPKLHLSRLEFLVEAIANLEAFAAIEDEFLGILNRAAAVRLTRSE
jgi:hypothetical protein